MDQILEGMALHLVTNSSIKSKPELHRTATFLYGVSALSMMGVTFISPVFPLMALEIGMTHVDMANMIAWFTFPALIFIPLWGFIADRFQRKIVLSISLLLFGICGSAIFFTDNMQTILWLRFAQGIGVSGIMPMSGTIIGDMFSKNKDLEVGAQGLRVVSINLAKFFYPIAGGLLGGIAWNLPFLFFFIAVPAGLYTIKYMPEMGAKEKEEKINSQVYFRLLGKALLNWSVLISYSVVFMRFFIKYGVYTFLPLMVLKYGMSAGEAGLVFSMMSLGLASVATQVKRLSKSRVPMEYIVLSGMILIGVVSIGFSIATSFISFLIVGLLYGIMEGFAAGLETSLLTQNTSRDIRAGIVSIGSWIRNLGKTISPLFFLYVSSNPEVLYFLSEIPLLNLDMSLSVGPDNGFILTGILGAMAGILIVLLIVITWILKKLIASNTS